MAVVHKNAKYEILKSQDKHSNQCSPSKPQRLQSGWKRAMSKERKIEILNFFSAELVPFDIKINYKLTIN